VRKTCPVIGWPGESRVPNGCNAAQESISLREYDLGSSAPHVGDITIVDSQVEPDQHLVL
jgi:hypothetical protein